MIMNVMNMLLGGVFFSCIILNICEDKGYIYLLCLLVMDCVGIGFWYQGVDVIVEVIVVLLSEIVKEINLLVNEYLFEKELMGVKNYMVGIFVLCNSFCGVIIS